jgi:predicted ester cyclase
MKETTMSNPATETALRFYQLISAGDADGATALVHPEYVGHGLGSGGGPESVRRDLNTWLAAVPDLTLDVAYTVTEGDRVVVRMTMSGTQSGEFARIPASGRSFRISATDILRVVDGAIVEAWTLCDLASMFSQVGALPSLPAGART